MKEINLFRENLHKHLQWNGARIAFVSMFLIALMRVKTVNLVEIATGFSGEAKSNHTISGYRDFFESLKWTMKVSL